MHPPPAFPYENFPSSSDSPASLLCAGQMPNSRMLG